jgi:NADP-dependent 3-hydroxy acid dehydrogenase YdfG
MSKTILITGATSGFGKAIAEKFAVEKWNCIITGRRKEKLEELARQLVAMHPVSILPLVFDVRNRQEVFDIIMNRKSVGNRWMCWSITRGLPPAETCLMKHHWMTGIDDRYQCKGLLYVSKAILPSMIARQGTYH